MFWTFLLAVSLANALVELGSASATLNIMTFALLASTLLVALLAIVLLWRESYSSNTAEV